MDTEFEWPLSSFKIFHVGENETSLETVTILFVFYHYFEEIGH